MPVESLREERDMMERGRVARDRGMVQTCCRSEEEVEIMVMFGLKR